MSHPDDDQPTTGSAEPAQPTGAAADPPGRPDAVEHLAHDLRLACMRISRGVRFDSRNAIQPHLFSVLARLDAAARTSAELATLERVSPPSMSKSVGALLERGLVRRDPDPQDGRQSILSLTPEGSAFLARQREARDAWMAERLEGLTAEERAVLARATDLLNRVVAG